MFDFWTGIITFSVVVKLNTIEGYCDGGSVAHRWGGGRLVFASDCYFAEVWRANLNG
jgi:hypothetical protein